MTNRDNVAHDHPFGQTSPDAIFNCIVKCYVFNVNFYLIRNTQYAIRNTQYAIDRTGRNDDQGHNVYCPALSGYPYFVTLNDGSTELVGLKIGQIFKIAPIFNPTFTEKSHN